MNSETTEDYLPKCPNSLDFAEDCMIWNLGVFSHG